MDRPIDNIENGMLLYSERDENNYTYDDYLADEADRRWKEEQLERCEMDDITKRLCTYLMLGKLYSESQEPKVKKAKCVALIPLGHRTKEVAGIFETKYPVSVRTMKKSIQHELRNKFNTTISPDKVQIDSFEILE